MQNVLLTNINKINVKKKIINKKKLKISNRYLKLKHEQTWLIIYEPRAEPMIQLSFEVSEAGI